MRTIALAANLFGVPVDDLVGVLTTKTTEVRGESVTMKLDQAKVCDHDRGRGVRVDRPCGVKLTRYSGSSTGRLSPRCSFEGCVCAHLRMDRRDGEPAPRLQEVGPPVHWSPRYPIIVHTSTPFL